MTRIVAGAAKGRSLGVPDGRGTRPTSDRAREAMFSTLTGLKDLTGGASFLDLFAGSGAVGLEALSRGATEVVLVESDAGAVRVIGDNMKALGLPGARVVRGTVERFLGEPPQVFDVVFADPPYQRDGTHLTTCLAQLCDGWTQPGTVVVVERPTRAGDWSWPAGIESLKSRRYGEGTLWYGRRS